MLQIRNLSKVFNKNTVNENLVFGNLSLNIEKGDFTTIIGSNGAGKSTLLNLISGSIESDGGSIMVKGTEVSNMPEYKRTRFIGRVFQSPTVGTSPSMTILENLSMAFCKGRKFNLSRGVCKKDIPYFKELLSGLSLGLEDRLGTKVGLLSGGQRQALSLIMASMSKPDLLLLDEHTAALDPRISEVITNLTEKIVNEHTITTMMVTHNLNQAINMGNRLLMFHGGEIVLDIKGEAKKKLTIDKLLECFERVKKGGGLSDRVLFSGV